MLDLPAAQAAAYLDEGVSAVRCHAESAAAMESCEAALGDASVGVELLAVTPAAVLALPQIAAAARRLVAIATDAALLLETYGLPWDPEVDITAYARGRVVHVARVREVAAIGRFAIGGRQRQVHPELSPARFSFESGYHGGLCATWDDVRDCNANYQPTAKRADEQRRILTAMEEGYAKGLGAVSLDGRMIDIALIPIAEHALAITDQVAQRTPIAARAFAAHQG
ncbi:MAG: hypothetical protein U0531_12605 [Dehalococcoidia bacterium]